MNRIILVVFLVLSYCVGTSQSISQRSQPVITVQDGRLFAQYNFRPPVFADTVEANLQIGLDSCGALIFSRDINSYYLRACSPKRWVAVSGGSNTGDFWKTSGTTTLTGATSIVSNNQTLYFGAGDEEDMQKITLQANDIEFTTTNGAIGISMAGLDALTDTSTYKPLMISSSGVLKQSTSWISGGGTASTVFQNEIHVSKDGSDATGDGTLLKPFATITKGLTIVDGTRKTIVLHPGSYSESPNITVQYTVITTFELLGGNTEIVGTVSTNTGCTISGIKMTNLNISNLTGTGNVNVLNCDISGTLTKSSSGDYTLIRFCDIATTSITGSGLVAIFGGNPRFATINNAAANVIVKNAVAVAPVLISGNANFVDCIIPAIATQWVSGTTYAASTATATVLVYNLGFTYSRRVAGAGTTAPASDTANWLLQPTLNGIDTRNAVTTASNTVVTIANCQIIVPSFNNVARISLAGFYSIINTVYDKTLSNFTGATSTNSIVYSQYINADKFIKQGGTTSQFLKANGDVDNNTYLTSAVTSVATSGLISGGTITNTGTISTSMNSGKLVGRNTTGVGIMEEITVGDGLTLTGAGVLNNTATPTPLGYYGSFYDTTTQEALLTNTAYAIKLGKTTLTNGVSIFNNSSSEPTRISIKNAGVYNLQFSLQLEKTGGSGNMTVDIWLRKNGVDIPNTTGKVVLTGSANASPTVSSWNYVLETADGEYYELMWATTNVFVKVIADVASSPHPAIPSAIFTVTQQSGIMAGTGITGMGTLGNIQQGPTQRLATGTGGTDFTITSAGNIHTFDIPNASTASVTRGLISNAQYSTFNGKQDAITFTTTGTSGAATFTSNVLNIPNYSNNDALVAQAYKLLGSSIKGINLTLPNYGFTTGAAQALASGTLRLIAYYLPNAQTITGVKWWQSATAVYVANNYNGVGLYSYAGGNLTLVASSTNDGTIWQTFLTNTMGSKAFTTPYSASAGMYFIGLLYSSASGTAPSLSSAGTTTQASMGIVDFTNSAKLTSTVAGQTSLPSTQAMSGTTLSSASLGCWLY